jgi:hypothetical protein
VAENTIIDLNHYKERELGTPLAVKKFIEPVQNRFKKLWKNEEAKFRIFTSLKMTMIPIFSFSLMGCFIWILLNMNLIFFRANEYRGISRFEEVFFDFLSTNLIELAPYGALLMIFVNVTALYVSDILLRPFRIIGDYCEKRNNGQDASYNPDFFTDLKLLSQFSEFFFSYMETAELNGVLHEVAVPKKYQRIHQPVFETTFFLHYLLYILASILAVSIALYAFANGLFENIILLADQTLPNNPQINSFLSDQKNIIDQIIWIVLAMTAVMYTLLATHLYYGVAAPAFAVFATMRTFLKGSYNQRVHLIGFPALRKQTRKLNKYLDWIDKNLGQKKQN